MNHIPLTLFWCSFFFWASFSVFFCSASICFCLIFKVLFDVTSWNPSLLSYRKLGSSIVTSCRSSTTTTPFIGKNIYIYYPLTHQECFCKKNLIIEIKSFYMGARDAAVFVDVKKLSKDLLAKWPECSFSVATWGRVWQQGASTLEPLRDFWNAFQAAKILT